MEFPERFSNLPDYAFPRLRALLDRHAPGGDVLHMSIGEPKHPYPEFVNEVIARELRGFNSYPNNNGTDGLLNAIADWNARRHNLTLDPSTEIMALNGTREGLFNAALALCPEKKNGQKPNVLLPNPFYQVYAIGTLMAQATPVYVNATAENGFLPDFTSLDAAILDQTAIAFICTPSNPQGAVADADYLTTLITLAEKHDFYIFSDECYSEIYYGDAPPSALQIARDMGADPNRVVVFNSLSKRSNLPGLRSGFVATGASAMAKIRQLRAYAGAPLPTPLQAVAEAVWKDEAHVVENRKLYTEKRALASDIFSNNSEITLPEGGFFLWLPVEDDDQATLELWKQQGIRVLPGSYLSRDTDETNPGKAYIRVAMVASFDQVKRGLDAIQKVLY
ncbi:MAG: aminotransferase class I/II-fold pyridoxal phosphate-dependent enzyme [Pseudomonadota bacterium]